MDEGQEEDRDCDQQLFGKIRYKPDGTTADNNNNINDDGDLLLLLL